MKNILTTHNNKLAMPVTCMARVRYNRLRRLAICAAVTDEWFFWCCSFKVRTRLAYDRKRLVYASIIRDIAENSKAGVVKSISIRQVL